MPLPNVDTRLLPATIDGVLEELDRVVDECRRTRSRLGYFAVLYRGVTAEVQRGIAGGRFVDGARMERLDVLFAGRYLDALWRQRAGQETTRSWALAFRAAATWPPVVLQHLLAGMNAHINLDLAIAAARTSPGAQLPGLERDFREITTLLDGMIESVQQRLNRISPWSGLLDALAGREDERLAAFGLSATRGTAWQAAQLLAAETPAGFDAQVALQDRIVEQLGRRILNPGPSLTAALWVVRARELRDPAAVIDVLAGVKAPG